MSGDIASVMEHKVYTSKSTEIVQMQVVVRRNVIWDKTEFKANLLDW